MWSGEFPFCLFYFLLWCPLGLVKIGKEKKNPWFIFLPFNFSFHSNYFSNNFVKRSDLVRACQCLLEVVSILLEVVGSAWLFMYRPSILYNEYVRIIDSHSYLIQVFMVLELPGLEYSSCSSSSIKLICSSIDQIVFLPFDLFFSIDCLASTINPVLH